VKGNRDTCALWLRVHGKGDGKSKGKMVEYDRPVPKEREVGIRFHSDWVFDSGGERGIKSRGEVERVGTGDYRGQSR